MIGLPDLEVCKSFFNITERNNKFELYEDSFNDSSFVNSKNVVEEVVNVPNISDKDLQNDTLGPIIIGVYRNLQLE